MCFPDQLGLCSWLPPPTRLFFPSHPALIFLFSFLHPLELAIDRPTDFVPIRCPVLQPPLGAIPMPFIHPARLDSDSHGPGTVDVMSATQLSKSKSRLGSKLKRYDLGKRRRGRTNLGDRARDARLNALKRAARRTSISRVAPLLASRSRLVQS